MSLSARSESSKTGMGQRDFKVSSKMTLADDLPFNAKA
jgi:hypothetical protein